MVFEIRDPLLLLCLAQLLTIFVLDLIQSVTLNYRSIHLQNYVHVVSTIQCLRHSSIDLLHSKRTSLCNSRFPPMDSR